MSVDLLRVKLELERERRRRETEHAHPQHEQLTRCAADPAYFIDAYGIIDDTQGHGEGGGVMPFKLWDAQKQVMTDLMTHDRVIILKARQLGISWLVVGYVLWLCMFQQGKTALLFSKGKEEANELIRRIAVLYDRLPVWLKGSSPLAKPPNVSEIVFANASRIKSLPATATAGSSFTAAVAVMDEAAKMQWAGQLYTAVSPTVAEDGQLILLSTAYGSGNFFHRIWKKAVAGENTFKTIFLPWWSRPSRDQAWYDRQVAEANDPEKVHQEFPADAITAFLVSGRTRFLPAWVAKQAGNVAKPLAANDPRVSQKLSHFDGLSVYQPPIPNRRYVIGADVAEGLENGDYSSAAVVDRETLTEHACLHGHWEPDEYARRLSALAEVYDAMIVVERNNHGHAVLLRLREICPKRVANGLDGRPGWVTSSATKPQSIDILAEHLRDASMTVRSQATLDEMQVYRVLAGGRTSAPEDDHDDRVMSWAVMLGWLALCHQDRKVSRGPALLNNFRG